MRNTWQSFNGRYLSVAVQNDLRVGGIIYAATLNVDTINAKLVKLLQMEAA